MRFLAFSLIGAVLALSVTAQETLAPEKVVKAQQVFRLAMADEVLGDMAARTGRLVAEQINLELSPQGKSLSAEQSNQLIARFTIAFVGEMKAMEPDVIKLYAKHLTERELDLMIDVYSNPEMAAVMAKMPRVMEEMMPLIQSSVPRLVSTVIGGMQADGLLSNL